MSAGIRVEWPYLYVAVAAAPRPTGMQEYVFRFECTGYPRIPATGSLWDIDANAILPVARWPGGRSRVSSRLSPDWKMVRAHICLRPTKH